MGTRAPAVQPDPHPQGPRDPAPGSPVLDTGANAPAPVSLAVPLPEHSFFPVSTAKFVAMSIFTFGIYPIYWSYKNWQRIKARSREDISPFWRAFFAPFFGFALFERVHEAAERKRLAPGWSSGFLGVLFFLLNITWRLPDPWWTISLLAFAPMVPVVRTIEQLHASEPSAEGLNSRYTGANIAAMIIGGILLLLALVGTFFMEPE